MSSDRPALERAADLVAAWLAGDLDEARFKSIEAADFTLFEAQRVGGVVYDLATRSSGSAAAAVATRLRPSYLRTLLRNDSLLAAAERTTALLVAGGIDVVRLKGSELLLGLYPSRGLRPMDDVDLLVAPRDLERALATLTAAGYRQPTGSLTPEFYREHHFHIALVEPGGAYVELHWQLLDPYGRGGLDAAALIAGAPPIDPARPDLGRRLADPVRFLYAAAHIDKHGPFHELLLTRVDAAEALLHPSSDGRLAWLVDLALIWRQGTISVDALVAAANQACLQRPLWTTLRLAAGLLGDSVVPVALIKRLRPPPDSAPRRWASALLGRLLLSDRRPARALIAWAATMDHAAHLRPLRLLALPLALLAGDATPRNASPAPDGWRRRAAAAWRAARLLSALVRHRFGPGRTT